MLIAQRTHIWFGVFHSCLPLYGVCARFHSCAFVCSMEPAVFYAFTQLTHNGEHTHRTGFDETKYCSLAHILRSNRKYYILVRSIA